MTDYGDDLTMLELLAPLRRLEPVSCTLQGPTPRRLRGPVLVAGVLAVALVLTGVAIAAGLGAFDGIDAAQHPQTGADAVDPATRAYMEGRDCSHLPNEPPPHCMAVVSGILWDTTRVVGQTPSGHNIYVFTTTSQSLCYVVGPPQPEWDCEDPLTRAHPSTVFDYTQDGSPYTLVGVVLDGVTSVSFAEGGQEITAPVKDNVWTYQTRADDAFDDAAGDLEVHFADGTTVVQTYP